jgi:hypothetical protein
MPLQTAQPIALTPLARALVLQKEQNVADAIPCRECANSSTRTLWPLFDLLSLCLRFPLPLPSPHRASRHFLAAVHHRQPCALPDVPFNCHSIALMHRAPECVDRQYSGNSYVFSFGFILYELIVGKRGFENHSDGLTCVKRILIDEFRPAIRAWVSADQDNRPPFDEIFERLKEMNFKVRWTVNSAKVASL